MWKIRINKSKESVTSWFFDVLVSQGDETYDYVVELNKEYYKKLTAERVPPRALIEQSFLFLLGNEPASTILKTFSLEEVADYFESFESTMQQILSI
ncbi:hypothetical protein IIB51_00740 [Patescibacteria group bacterium]|nr:hypothetical protein [Patescibacteria group bacterium]MCH8889231.1 hypothetical protein [Patescibacteria group bacterium]